MMQTAAYKYPGGAKGVSTAMEKIPEKPDMTLPMYKVQVPVTTKWWIVGIGLAVLLVGIIVAASLIGVYLTQKHTEKMVMQVYNAMDGQRVQQIISVNEQENMAAIFVSSRNYSATVLYDYRRNLIGIRMPNSSICCVLRMDRSQIPSMQDILREMDNTKTHNASSDNQITYYVAPEQTANPMDMGTSMNILCSNVDIWWAKLEGPRDVRRFRWRPKIPKIKWSVSANLGIKLGN